MGFAKVLYSRELLQDLMCLPDTCKIALVQEARDYARDVICFWIQSPEFPDTVDIPIITPTFKREPDPDAAATVTRMIDWGYPKKENAV